MRGTGSDNIVGRATLLFTNVVAATQTVYFTGANGVLDLKDLGGFSAHISGFDTVGVGDALLIGGSGWSFTGAAETTSAATLGFVNGSAHQKLTLLGDYVGGDFSALTFGAGEFEITFKR